jgi:hypothetical protein
VELTRDRGMWIGPHVDGAPSRQLGVELPADGLDLGKLGHEIRLIRLAVYGPIRPTREKQASTWPFTNYRLVIRRL